MLKIWGRRSSMNVQAVMWTVAELGLDHERYDVGHKYGGNHTAEFLAMNPNGLVPVVKDGDDAPLFESAAICRYLASRYGNDTFWPADASARAQIDKWAEWAKVTMAAAFTISVFWRVIRTKPEERDQAALEQSVAAFENLLAVAAAQLEQHEFFTGDDLTLADIMLGHVLFRYFTVEIDRSTPEAIVAYYERLKQRPAYAENVMVSFDELRP